MIHVKNSDKQTLQRNGKKRNELFHGLGIVVTDRSWPQYWDTAFKNLVDISNVLRVVLDWEVHESNFKFKELEDLNGLSLFFNDLVCVFLNKFEDFLSISWFFLSLTIWGGSWLIARTRKLGKLIHQIDEDILDINLMIQIRSRIKKCLQWL